MTKAAAAIEALMEIHPKGFDLSLDRITGLLEKLGNPQDKLPPVIHVAGTNGKGSTIAFCRAILEAAGLAVHVHTSPHLVHWHERYRIGHFDGGRLVDDTMLTEAIDRVASANDGQPITVFEVLTVVTFILFSENPADVCLIEVGLGGQFDATNVMKQTALSIITPVDLDHEAFLGDTIAKIAFEKAGILKQKTPVVVARQHDDAQDVIERQASRTLSPVIAADEHFSAHIENGRLVFQDEEVLFDLPIPALNGLHQIDNGATAIAACRRFAIDHDKSLSEAHIERGMAMVSWPGRMQKLPEGDVLNKVPKNTEIWIDGGHNPGAARIVADFINHLQQKDPRQLIIICGMLNTKDPAGYFEALAGLADRIITVPIASSDAGIDPTELAAVASSVGHIAQAERSLASAFDQIAPDNQSPRVLICGSLYLVGEVLQFNQTPPQ